MAYRRSNLARHVHCRGGRRSVFPCSCLAPTPDAVWHCWLPAGLAAAVMWCLAIRFAHCSQPPPNPVRLAAAEVGRCR